MAAFPSPLFLNFLPQYFYPVDPSSSFENKLIQEFFEHSQLMSQVIEQTQRLNESFHQLTKELSLLKFISNDALDCAVPTKQTVYEVLGIHNEHHFAIELSGILPNPVCKGKYFTFKVKISNNTETQFPMNLALRVMMNIYSAEIVPKLITVNMNGRNILKGSNEVDLKYDPIEAAHVGSFKVQLNEVTSHFRNGWVFLVVQPVPSDFLLQTGFMVSPLVIEHLVSKSKEVTCDRWRAKGRVSDIKPESNE